MSEPSIHDLISKNFSDVGKDEWVRAARAEMPENISLENLSWAVDGISFSPYYIEADLKQTEYLKSFHNCSNPLLSTLWLNIPQISVINVDEAYEKTSSFLQKGADGILYDLTNLRDPDINKFINGLNWDDNSISFRTSDTKVVTDIFACAGEKYNPTKLKGSIWWNQLPKTEQLVLAVAPYLKEYKNYHLLGIQISPNTPIKEISSALAQGVKLIDEMTNLKINRDAAFRSLSLSFFCDENILVNIAKLRSIRMLWYQLSQAFEIQNYSPTDLQIHCLTGHRIAEKFQPHGNMIRNTYQVISAITGGANEITVVDGEEEHSMIERVALNVTNILKEESHFGKVADPLAGSYVIEKMVHEFSQAAWDDFQSQQS